MTEAACGQRTQTETSNYKFTDQELDPESGLYNYNARLCDTEEMICEECKEKYIKQNIFKSQFARDVMANL
jgi:hypothetical protein